MTAGPASASIVVVPSSLIRTNWAQFEADLTFKHGGYSEFSITVSYIDISTHGNLNRILFTVSNTYYVKFEIRYKWLIHCID